MKQRNFQQAVADFSKAVQVRPDREELLVLRAECFGKQGKSQSALEDFNSALAMAEKDALVYLKRGQFFLAEKKYSQAIDDFTEALNEDSGLQKAYLGRGNAYRALKRYSLATADFRKARELKRGGDGGKTVDEGGVVRVEKPDEKERSFKEAENSAAISGKKPGNLMKTGKLKLGAGDADSAIKTLEKEVRNSPANARARRYLANAYRRRGNQRQAQIQLEALESMGAASPVDRLDLARMWIAAGKRQKAIDLARKGMQSARSQRVSGQFKALLESMGEN